MTRAKRGRWHADAYDRDLGPCEVCHAPFRRPCVGDGKYARSPHEGRRTDPRYAVLHQAVSR